MPDRETRKTQITAKRQEQILKAAVEIFTHKGFAAATIPEIARLAGVAAGTIYIYFPSKRELFLSVIKNTIINPSLLNLLTNMNGADVNITFRQVMQNRLDLLDNETMLRIPSLMGEIMRDPELKTLWRDKFILPMMSQMESVYRKTNAPEKAESMEPAIAVRAIAGMIIGFLMLRIMEGETSPLNKLPRNRIAAELANFIIHGLANENKK
ncbi:MAG: TetR/AcrR family transcriptional regulator [Dehalococcoidales bacterium]|nr:TetR/AcrR family transcriptional regulator [Dehalococcoidales bacterium]